ncbi:MAG: S8 family serine peptidase, partial [Bacteroidales bacterium]|nr:S8 family serine peptidase [Bacteroidales bacterium]
MKKFYKIIICISCLLASFTLYSQNNYQGYHYANGTAHYWTDDSTSLNLIVKNMEHYDTIVSKIQLFFANDKIEIIADNDDDNIIINSAVLPLIPIDSLIVAIQIDSDDICFFSYAKLIEKNRIWLRNEVVIRYKENMQVTIAELQNSLSNYDLINITFDDYIGFSILCRTEHDVVEIANLLYDTLIVEYSSPDYYCEGGVCTADPLYSYQWGLNNLGINHSGQPYGIANVDINAPEAWNFVNAVAGSLGNNIKVAILDDGVENHEDLFAVDGSSKVLSGYTANRNESGNGQPNNNKDGHGENCSGIIAATHNNNKGIAGVSPDVLIVPIKMIGKNGTYRSSRIAKAVSKSWKDFGASILNCSWHQNYHHDVVKFAFRDALNQGRNGLGCVVACSSGNKNESQVSFPGRYYQDILVVGAISRCGVRGGGQGAIYLNPPCDPWGGYYNTDASNYGEKLDVVAPGSYICTIDRAGSLGFTPSSYDDAFNGTSAACPHVSGLAALILTVNPALTKQQISVIIESTAKKAGNYNYQSHSSHPNGTWNNQLGYGMIDAYAAVVKAYFYDHSITGSNTATYCQTQSFSYSNTLPPSMQIEWVVNPPFVLISGQNTNTVSVKVVGSYNGSASINANIIFQNETIKTFTKNIIMNGLGSLGTVQPYQEITNGATLTLNTNKHLTGHLKVFAGSTLILNNPDATYSFSPNSNIILEDGAQL